MINSAAKAPQEPPNPGQIRQECSAFPAPGWGLMKECDPAGFSRELSGFLWEWGHGGSGPGEEIGEEGLEKIPGLVQGWEGVEQLLGGGEGKGASDAKSFPYLDPNPNPVSRGFLYPYPNPDPISRGSGSLIPSLGVPHPHPNSNPISRGS